MSSTNDNLKAAFAGESQASRKYTYFSQKADGESLKQVARLFRAAADAETVHARNHLNEMGGIGNTRENLAAAIAGEHYEFMQMYPGFIKQAEAENVEGARTSFDLANKVEQIHHGLYQAALKSVELGKSLAEEPYFVCQSCGNTVAGKAPDKCPICGSPQRMFKRID